MTETNIDMCYYENMKGNKTRNILYLLVTLSILLLVYGYTTNLKILEEGQYGILILGYKILQNFLVEGDAYEIKDSIILIIGSFMAPLSLASSVLVSLFEAGNKTVLSLYIRLFFKNHIIVAGDNLDSQQLLSSKTSSNRKKIVLIVNNLETVPNYIVENKNILILNGDIEEKKIWLSSSVYKAQSVIISLNDVDKAPYISEIIEILCKKNIPEIHIGLRNSDQSMIVNDKKNMLSSNPRLSNKIKPFSMLNLSSIALIEQYSLHKYYTMEILTKNRIHVVFYGFTPITTKVLLELLHTYIYPNREKTLITFINKTKTPIDDFIMKYPGFTNVADYVFFTEKEFIDILRSAKDNPFSQKPLQYIFFLENSWEIPRISRNFRRFILKEYGKTEKEIPLLYLLPDNEEYPMIHKSYSTHYSELGINVIGETDYVTIDSILENEKIFDSIAQNIHNSYRELYDIEPWEELTEREKDFNRRSARHYNIKLAFLGFKITDRGDNRTIMIPELTNEQIMVLAEMEHRRWCTEKHLDDFIYCKSEMNYYNEHKKELRLHSDLIPFNELTENDIDKDINTFKNWNDTLKKVLINKVLIKL